MVMLWLYVIQEWSYTSYMYRVHAVLLCCAVLSPGMSVFVREVSAFATFSLFLVVGDEWTGTGECVSE